jgi:hypothetical protein
MVRNVRYKNKKQNFDEEVSSKDAGSGKKIITDRKILTVMSIEEISRY